MEKRYWNIVVIYVIMYFSGFLGGPLLLLFGIPEEQIAGLWIFVSFTACLIWVLFLLKPEIQHRNLNKDRSTLAETIMWSISGVFIAFIAQAVAANIEIHLLGIEAGSENTEMLMEIAKITPLTIIVVAIIAPILEEIIFRKILFGVFYKRFNFWIAAFISSLIFAAVHWDFTHILIYSSMGFTFAFLYVKTKRIIVPIIAHASMNTLAVLVNLVFADDIKKLEEQMQQVQTIIGGFFS